MAIIRSNKIVYLDREGNVLRSEDIDLALEARAAVNAEACYAQLNRWQQAAKASYHAPITRETVPGEPGQTNDAPFGHCKPLRPYGKRYRRFSTK